jgi:putative membrane protein
MWGDMGSMMGWGGGWQFFGVLQMLLWSVPIILGVVVLVKWLSSAKRDAPSLADRALEILRERYARGEIDKDEFDKRKRDLEV